MAVRKQVSETKARRIVHDPEVCGGDPTIDGTRIPVASIVVTYQYYRDLDRVHHAYPRANLHTIEAALAYYDEHREEIDRLIDENERAIEAAD